MISGELLALDARRGGDREQRHGADQELIELRQERGAPDEPLVSRSFGREIDQPRRLRR